MKRCIMTFLLCLLLVVLLPQTAQASAEVVDSGTCGNNLEWTLYQNGELHITGTGAMPNFSSQSSPWYSYRTKIISVTIADGISSIGKSAFYNCSSLAEISIPEGVTSIGGSAFYNCSSLAEISIPEGVTSIGGSAFYNCSSLAEISIPEGVTSIGGSAFESCVSLVKISIPEGVTDIGGFAFQYCSALAEISIPEGVTAINSHTFYRCSSLTKISIPEGVTSIGSTAFGYCSSLTDISIPDSVTFIGESIFFDCSSLTEISIPEGVTSIGTYVFNGCVSLTKVSLPDSLVSIGNAPFSGCASLTEITIPDGVVSIDSYAFNGCSSLTEISIPDSVTSIGQNAFQGCRSLQEIIIGRGVTSIGSNAFFRSPHETSSDTIFNVEFLGNAPIAMGLNVFPDLSAGFFAIRYHAGTTGWTSPTWNGYYTICIGETLGEFSTLDESCHNSQGLLFTLNDTSLTAVVGDNSFASNNSGYYGNNDGNVVIPATVTKDGKTYKVIGIGQHAFDGNKFLRTLELGNNITSVDTTAFLSCPVFEAFTVAPGSTYYSANDGILYDAVGYYLYCYPAAKVGSSYTVPATVKAIGQNAFYGNMNLIELIVPDNVQTIGANAFLRCDNLESITLPFIGSSRTTSHPFAYVFSLSVFSPGAPKSLKTVVITGGTLNPSSFSNCSSIESITLPAQDTVIPNNCFYNCNALTTLVFSDMPEASNSPEDGCLVLPERITSIGYEAFRNCSALTRVEIHAGVSFIGDCAFDGCTAVAEFVVDEANQNYCSDQWGVLYSKDMSTLVSYPANRIWPYYNVSDETTRICEYAFNGCANLVNLYIPSTVTNLNRYCITNCPGLTVCAYADSQAFYYAGVNNLNAWPMDNYELQGIEIYALPEQAIQQKGSEDFSGLYMTMNYGGRTLQLDDYTLTYDPDKSGVQTVTVTFNGYTASFEILLYNGETEYLMDFGELNLAAGTMGLVCAYDTDGKLLKIESVGILNGRALLTVPQGTAVGTAKLFILDKQTLSPVGAPILPKTE